MKNNGGVHFDQIKVSTEKGLNLVFGSTHREVYGKSPNIHVTHFSPLFGDLIMMLSISENMPTRFTLLICSAGYSGTWLNWCHHSDDSCLELASLSWEPLCDAAVSCIHTLHSVVWNSTVTQMVTLQLYIVYEDAYVDLSCEYQWLCNQTLRTESTAVWFKLMLLLMLRMRWGVLISLVGTTFRWICYLKRVSQHVQIIDHIWILIAQLFFLSTK